MSLQTRYHDIAEVMESKPGLAPDCTAAEADWRQCMFSQYSLKYHKTPTFVINSLYNFGEWAMLNPGGPPGTFPPDSGAFKSGFGSVFVPFCGGQLSRWRSGLCS